METTDSAWREVRDFLERKYSEYNREEFIASDPVSIPHRYSSREDREVSGFLTATISWGKRSLILNSAGKMMELMEDSPYEFMIHAGPKDLKSLRQYVHRTFNGEDLIAFIRCMRRMYQEHEGLEPVLSKSLKQTGNMMDAIALFRAEFFKERHPRRTEKHVSDPSRNSSAKRINMFLRWMVRKDAHGVDLGIWKKIPVSELMIPLDVHVGNVARELGLLTRKQDDRKAVEELTAVLRTFDPKDPVRYDFALFGVGVSEKST